MTTPTPRPKRPPRTRSASRGLVTLLWRQALIALPMALCFGVLHAQGAEGYLKALLISLVFSYVIGLALWTMPYFIVPRLPARPGESHTAGLEPGDDMTLVVLQVHDACVTG